MFAHRQRLRHLAARVLFAWLLALATGVVNACVVGPGVQHVPVASGHEHCAGMDDAGKSQRSACAKFCDEPSTGVQNPKAPTDPSGAAVLAVLPTSSTAAAWLSAGARAPLRDTERWRPLAPIPIAFLRLTL